MKHIHYYIIGLYAMLFIGACSTSRKVLQETPVVVSEWKTGESVVAKSSVRLSASDGKSVNVSATLRMRRDDVIQINATYFLGIQIGTLELTSDSVLVLSRATRQYAVLAYQELSALMGRSITFADMQNVFWGEAEGFNVKGVDWKYGSFVKMQDGRRLPGNLEVKIIKGTSSLNVDMSISNYKYEDGWTLRTKVNTSNYKSLSSEQLLKLLTLLIG